MITGYVEMREHLSSFEVKGLKEFFLFSADDNNINLLMEKMKKLWSATAAFQSVTLNVSNTNVCIDATMVIFPGLEDWVNGINRTTCWSWIYICKLQVKMPIALSDCKR